MRTHTTLLAAGAELTEPDDGLLEPEVEPDGGGSLTPHPQEADVDAPDFDIPDADAPDAPDSAEPVDPAPIDPSPAAPEPDIPAGPRTIVASQVLTDRPDVLRAFYEEFYGPGNDRNSDAWVQRVGGDTPEAYARYWYDNHGRYEGYSQGAGTAGDNVSLERILQERPDVLRAFFETYYGDGNDRNSDAWMKRVGGETPEAYAKYWYEKYGKWEGYSQTEKASAENIHCERLLQERPDVFRAFFTEYYGANNDRHSSAWVDRVGGDTVEDYAKYWYVTYGRNEGYTQRTLSDGAPQVEEPATPVDPGPVLPPAVEPPSEDPSLDPWNHPAIYPDWTPPYPGWRPPGSTEEPPAADLADEALLEVGKSLIEAPLFG